MQRMRILRFIAICDFDIPDAILVDFIIIILVTLFIGREKK